MTFNITDALNETYMQSPQSNPLLWRILYKDVVDGKEVFLSQTNNFKCKDFFNDIVALYHGDGGRIYGLDTRNKRVNEEGVWVLLSHLVGYDRWKDNVDSLMAKAIEQNLPPIESHLHKDGTQALVFIPRVWFDCTWSISMLTYCLRICNVDVEIKGWGEMLGGHPTKGKDNPMGGLYDQIMKQGFIPPNHGKGLWYYSTGCYNSFMQKQGKISFSIDIVHDNGCQNWMMAVNYNKNKNVDGVPA